MLHKHAQHLWSSYSKKPDITRHGQVLNLTNCPWSQVNPPISTELRHQHMALKTTLARGEEGIELKAAIGATSLLKDDEK